MACIVLYCRIYIRSFFFSPFFDNYKLQSINFKKIITYQIKNVNSLIYKLELIINKK